MSSIAGDAPIKKATLVEGNQDPITESTSGEVGANVGYEAFASDEVKSSPALPSSLTVTPANKAGQAARIKKDMLDHIHALAEHYDIAYAPKQEKYDDHQWRIDTATEKAMHAIQQEDEPSVELFQGVVKEFVAAMRDYHVSVSFVGREKWTLPFRIVPIGDKFYIGQIDRTKASESSFPFNAGDEITSFGGKPIEEAVAEMDEAIGPNLPWTNRWLAAGALTRRAARKADPTPDEKLVTIGVKPKGQTGTTEHQMGWEFTKSDVRFERLTGGAKEADHGPRMEMGGWQDRFGDATDTKTAADPFQVGGRKSYVPELGTVIEKGNPKDPFESYIYRHPSGKLVGYIRIPTYSPKDPEKFSKAWKARIKHLQEATDGLVVDQVNNPGGLFYLAYDILSTLTDQPLATPKHRVALTARRVAEAQETLAKLETVKDDKTAQKAFGKTWAGFPINYDVAQKLGAYARTIVEDFEAGERMSRPVHLQGVDKINPSTEVKYTKPITFLINELDFSNGDFAPAILQDNKRATLHGRPTAGAGGFVETYEMPNYLGVDKFSITGSVADRPTGDIIEGKGVHPDVEYVPTEEDIQGDFGGLRDSINDTIGEQLEEAEREAERLAEASA